MPKYLTAAEVAAILRCSEKTIYKMGKDGRLAKTYVGRLVRFTEANVAEYAKLNSY